MSLNFWHSIKTRRKSNSQCLLLSPKRSLRSALYLPLSSLLTRLSSIMACMRPGECMTESLSHLCLVPTHDLRTHRLAALLLGLHRRQALLPLPHPLHLAQVTTMTGCRQTRDTRPCTKQSRQLLIACTGIGSFVTDVHILRSKKSSRSSRWISASAITTLSTRLLLAQALRNQRNALYQ